MKCFHCQCIFENIGEEFEPCDDNEISLITNKKSDNSIKCVNNIKCINRINTLLMSFHDYENSYNKSNKFYDLGLSSIIEVLDFNNIGFKNKTQFTSSSNYILINEMIDIHQEELPYDKTEKHIIAEIVDEIVDELEDKMIESIDDSAMENVYDIDDEIED